MAAPAAKTRGSKAADAGTTVTHPERVVFPARAGVAVGKTAISKGEVADYYRAVAPRLLAEIRGRPLSLLRCPDGLKGQCFFQKHHSDALGAHVQRVPLKEKDGGRVHYVTIDDADGLLELVQMNTLEFHPWGARADDPEHPDRLVFDLDPGDGVAWKTVVAGARDVRARLDGIGLDSWCRLSGGKGVHVVVPIRRGPTWAQAKAFCEAFADAMTAHQPQTYLATAGKARRGGKIFIDWLRNARGATSVASWSLRARAGAPVAMPIRWDELGRAGSAAAYDLRKALRRAATLQGDPWEGFARSRQALPKL